MPATPESASDEGASRDNRQLSAETIAEIKRRCAELDKNPSIALTEEEMWRRVDELLDQQRANRSTAGD